MVLKRVKMLDQQIAAPWRIAEQLDDLLMRLSIDFPALGSRS